VTTIAWRLCHVGAEILEVRAASHFGAPPIDVATHDWPATADEGIAFVEDAYARWREGVHALDDEALARPVGPAEGPFAPEPMLALVLHINRECIHHLAEVCLLRDLYRTRTTWQGAASALGRE
jgi:hypothetical protein